MMVWWWCEEVEARMYHISIDTIQLIDLQLVSQEADPVTKWRV